MKKAFLFFILFSATSSLFAKDIVDGYLILSTNDTIKCKIKVPVSLEMFNKVSIIDSNGKTLTYKAQNQEINGFGFIYENQKYDYVTKRTDDYGSASFLMTKAVGRNLNLYYSYYFSTPYNGGASYRTDVYLLEDSQKRIVYVSGGVFSAYKKKIKNFLKDDPKLLQLFDKMVLSITDIPDFVKDANRW